MSDKIYDLLNIRYVKLHFEIELLYDSLLSVYKPFALRGGMVQMLMAKYCMSDQECDYCAFASECLVTRIKYSDFEIKPYFIKEKGNCGYIIECEDYRTRFSAGNELHFSVVLFGKTIVHFQHILDAFIDLGKEGLGTNKVLFEVKRVTNSLRQEIYRDGNLNRDKYNVLTVEDYVNYRLSRKVCHRVYFQTPAKFVVRKKLIEEFDPAVLFKSIARRLYILNSFEGNDIEQIYSEVDGIDPPAVINQCAWIQRNARYSTRQKQRYVLTGIKGYIDFGQLSEAQYILLLAGELIHVGKETAFGYGKYSMVNDNRNSVNDLKCLDENYTS